MKKSLFTLLLLIPLVACQTSKPKVTLLKVESTGHFSEAQLNYLSNDDYSNTSPYNGNMSVSKPVPVKISWESDKETAYSVELYNDESFSNDSLIVTYQTKDTSLDFYNPIFNQTYFVRVFGYDDVTREVYEPSNVLSFKESPTVNGPRNLCVDGVENFRDIGGWGYIKQGMLYRSGRFNEEKVDLPIATITEQGIHEAIHNLKIKTEIDLRRTSTNEVGGLKDESVLGKVVKYKQLPMAFGGKNILTFQGKLNGDDYEYDNPAMIKEFFTMLANKDNYPINFHCSIGKDRTGCLAYLVEGLLGFDQQTMYRDYMFTNFADAGMCKISDITDRYGQTIEEYANGGSLQEKIYNYLNEVIGVSRENLDNVINILKA